jgi:hypothetical protein
LHLGSINGEIVKVNIFPLALLKVDLRQMNISEIDRLLTAAQAKLVKLDAQRLHIQKQIETLKTQKESADCAFTEPACPRGHLSVSNQSPAQAKISLFRMLFRGRDTVTRKDGHHPIIFMNCGPVRYRVDDRTQTAARPFTHRVILRNTGFTLPAALTETKEISIHDLYMVLISDQCRNDMIIQDVLRVVSEGRSPVLLTERTSHLEFLAERLSSQIKNVMVFKGGMGKKQRQQLAEKLASIPDDEERIILATGRYLGEGFDDARLDTLFLTLPVSWRGTITQYAGRLHRSHDMKKEVLIYDYADLNVPILAKMYRRRCRGYTAIGYEIVVYHDAVSNLGSSLAD